MRIVLQRVKSASVSVDSAVIGSIGQGILLLIGIGRTDTVAEADILAAKCVNLRIFEDDRGKMNRSLAEVDGEVLVVSQFTLYGDCRKGNRPSFVDAAPPERGRMLYDHFVSKLKQMARKVETGSFGALMEVALVNHGPVTIVLEKDPVPSCDEPQRIPPA